MVFAKIGCSHVQNVMYFPHTECVRILCNLFSIPLLVYAYISGILVVVMSQGMCTQHMHFLPARRYASTGTSYGPVSVCLSQLGVLSKGMNGLIWFLAWKLLLTSPSLCFTDILVSI